jgi:hypothetical protein
MRAAAVARKAEPPAEVIQIYDVAIPAPPSGAPWR